MASVEATPELRSTVSMPLEGLRRNNSQEPALLVAPMFRVRGRACVVWESGSALGVGESFYITWVVSPEEQGHISIGKLGAYFSCRFKE